jgi:hypothetical protein
MKIRMAVTQDGATTEVSTNLWAVVQWERKYKTKISQAAESMGLEDLAYLAYESLKTSGQTVPAVFDDFIRKVDNIEVLDSETARPTQGEPTAAA